MAAATTPFPYYKNGGSGIGRNSWKVYIITPPATLCARVGASARLTRVTFALANNANTPTVAVSANVFAGLFAVDAATQQPVSPASPVAQTPPLAVTVPYCSACRVPPPSTDKPVFTLALGSAAWEVKPGVPFAFGLASDAATSTALKWANVADGPDPVTSADLPVVGASGFTVATDTWAYTQQTASWGNQGPSNNNDVVLEFQCFGGC